MAWNPSPEVRVARDAAASMSRILDERVDRIIVLYTTAEGHWGYASYGTDAVLCREAKSLADVLSAVMLAEMEHGDG